ncbi:MAG: hypothetical protein WCF19_05370 [Chlamydiales bacterium]
MAIDFMDFLKDAFEGIDTLNREQIRKVLAETHTYFQTLENTLRYGDAQSKEDAVAEALELKEFLDSKAGQVSKFKGLDSLTQEEQEIVTEINGAISLSQSSQNKIKINKLKPTKLS